MRITVYDNQLTNDKAYEVVLSERNVSELIGMFLLAQEHGVEQAGSLMKQVALQEMLYVRMEADDAHYGGTDEEMVTAAGIGGDPAADGDVPDIRWRGLT